MELISPAGSLEAVRAAVRGGANAVSFPLSGFGARSTEGLSAEETAEAVKYCRLRGIRVYAAADTLVTDPELLNSRPLAARLNTLGADGIVVRDLGMARMIRSLAPDLPLHGSVRLSVHNLGGVLALQKLGFSRVTLASELPQEEISFLCKNSPIGLEVLIHGSQCVCHSGQCYFPSAVGGRSDSRGPCSQPCRAQYGFFGDCPSYPLSLKSPNLAEHLSELADMGISAVRIGDGISQPEYAAMTSDIYSRALRMHRAPARDELSRLESAFFPGGFTDGYYSGQKPEQKGDGMFGFSVSGDSRGTRAILREAHKIYQTEPEPPLVPVDMTFTARAEQEMRLLCIDTDGNEYGSVSLPPERTSSRATSRDDIRACLLRTGDTVFAPREIHIALDDGLRLPLSAVNAMRRQCLEGLAAIRRTPPKRGEGIWQPGVKRLSWVDKPSFIYSFLRYEQLTPEILDHKPAFIFLPLSETAKHIDLAKEINSEGINVAAVLDRVIMDHEWPETLQQLRVLRDAGIAHLACTNLGQIALLEPLGFNLHGDFGLNVVNSQTVKELRQMSLTSCTLSFELSLNQIRALSMGMDCQILAYGRLPLMITENCIFRRKNSTCTCNMGGAAVIDKTGRSYPLLRENNCRTAVYSAEKLYLADKLPELFSLGVRLLRLCFTTENAKECAAIIRAYEGGSSAMPERMTRGMYFRGL